jgi:hypothetical protein
MAGAWYDPDHRIQVGFTIGDPTDLFRQAYFGLSQRDDVHGCLGVAFSQGSWSFGASFDFSERTETASLALVKRL